MSSLPQEVLENVVKHMSLEDTIKMDKSAGLNNTERRCDPVLYMSDTFRKPMEILRVMAMTGTIIAEDRAVSYFTPGSVSSQSPWVFYCKASSFRISHMMNVLSYCGVEWKHDYDRCIALYNGKVGHTETFEIGFRSKIFSEVLGTGALLRSVFTDMPEEGSKCMDFVSKLIVEILTSSVNTRYAMGNTEDIGAERMPADDELGGGLGDELGDELGDDTTASVSPYIRVIVTKTREFGTTPDVGSISALVEHVNEDYSNGLPYLRGEGSHVIHGDANAGDITIPVELVFSEELDPLDIITRFPMSHQQCFLGGWGAVRIVDPPHSPNSWVWNTNMTPGSRREATRYVQSGHTMRSYPRPADDLGVRFRPTYAESTHVSFYKYYKKYGAGGPGILKHIRLINKSMESVSWVYTIHREFLLIEDSLLRYAHTSVRREFMFEPQTARSVSSDYEPLSVKASSSQEAEALEMIEERTNCILGSVYMFSSLVPRRDLNIRRVW